MSQKTPLARKPWGATMEPGISLNDFLLMTEMNLPTLCHDWNKFSAIEIEMGGAAVPPYRYLAGLRCRAA
jgi:hypothetical protein